MNALTKIRLSIENFFFSEFQAVEPTVHISVENDNWVPNIGEDWVRLRILYSSNNYLSLGIDSERYRGFVQIQVYTEIGKGAGRLDGLSDTIAGLFRSKVSDGVHYGNSQPPKAVSVRSKSDGYSEGFGWFQGTVLIPFRADIFH